MEVVRISSRISFSEFNHFRNLRVGYNYIHPGIYYDENSIPIEFVQEYRQGLYRSPIEIESINAVGFINKRGILAFWPLKDIPMPSLWAATAGDRPVPDDHDDPGHVTWGWKMDYSAGKAMLLWKDTLPKEFFC